MMDDKAMKTVLNVAERFRFTGWYPEEECYVNLAGNYDYLELPYYISQDFEHKNLPIRPTCKEMLDAYVPPLFLEKARLTRVPVPEFYISNAYFEPPVIIDPINPFMIKSRVVLKPGREHAIAKSMTRNYTYAICCQEIPPDSHIVYFKSLLGWSSTQRYRELSSIVWNVFHIPVARVRTIVTARGSFLLSDISPYPFNNLNKRELGYLMEHILWEK
jgi:hypothetical protein